MGLHHHLYLFHYPCHHYRQQFPHPQVCEYGRHLQALSSIDWFPSVYSHQYDIPLGHFQATLHQNQLIDGSQLKNNDSNNNHLPKSLMHAHWLPLQVYRHYSDLPLAPLALSSPFPAYTMQTYELVYHHPIHSRNHQPLDTSYQSPQSRHYYHLYHKDQVIQVYDQIHEHRHPLAL